MNWLSQSFAPKANALFSTPILAGISSSMQKIIPFILTGSIVYLYNVLRSYAPMLPDLSPIANFSFGIISLLISFMIANQIMEKLNHPAYIINAGLSAICTLMMIAYPIGKNTGDLNKFLGNIGPTGMLLGMLVGLFVALVFHLWAKLNFLKDSSIPDFVTSWINTIVPNIIVLTASMIIVFTFKIDLLASILSLFMPISAIAQTLPGFIIISMLYNFFYTLGISTWLWNAVTTPIFLLAIQANVDAVASGDIAKNIVTYEAFFTLAFITMGGVCATLGLNILMIFSKSTQLKMLGRVFLVPSIFNINEPIMFGAPVVFNPILMLPAWINGIVGPIYIWILMSTGLLKIPAAAIQVGQIPAPITSVMVTQDVRAILWWGILLVIYTITWYPFFKIYEKQKLALEV